MHEQMSKKQFLADICARKKNKNFFLVIHAFHVSNLRNICMTVVEILSL